MTELKNIMSLVDYIDVTKKSESTWWEIHTTLNHLKELVCKLNRCQIPYDVHVQRIGNWSKNVANAGCVHIQVYGYIDVYCLYHEGDSINELL